MNFLERMNRSVIYIGYLLLAIAINGFFGIYLPDEDSVTFLIGWLVLAGSGGLIVALKTLKFPPKERLKVIGYDLAYLLILILFAVFSLPYGINFVLGSVIAVLFLNTQIDQKILVQLNE